MRNWEVSRTYVGAATVLCLCLAVAFPAASSARVPLQATYDIQLTGLTYAWHGNAQAYLPREQFSRGGRLFVDPHPVRRRRRSFGLFSGTPTVLAEAGAVQLATNTRSFRHRRGYGRVAAAALEFAPAVVGRRRARATVDERIARTQTVQLFHTRTVSFPFGAPVQILAGRLQLRFSRTGRSVRGRLRVVGNKLIEPGNAFPVDGYDARIVGRRVR